MTPEPTEQSGAAALAARPTGESRFSELKRYLRFDDADARALALAYDHVQPRLGEVVEAFYERLAEHDGATRVFADMAQVERLKRTLVEWLDGFFAGPHDEVYFQVRARIGRVHVAVGLEPRYMVLAMGLLREHLLAILRERPSAGAAPDSTPGPDLRLARVSVAKLCDIELAIMLETYSAEMSAVLKRRERLATLGQLTASISHEVKNPLSVIASSVYALRAHCERLQHDAAAAGSAVAIAEPVRRHLERIHRNVEQAGAIVTTLLDFMRHHEPTRVCGPWSAIVREAVAGVELPEGIEVTLAMDGDPGLAAVDPVQIGRVLANLLRNAAEAMGGAGEVELAAGGDERTVWARVRDHGAGIRADLLPSLFEPLRTTKEVGTGLGLALCKAIVDGHGGRIAARNHEGGGAEVRFELPRRLEGTR